jgi:hypothetical protein
MDRRSFMASIGLAALTRQLGASSIKPAESPPGMLGELGPAQLNLADSVTFEQPETLEFADGTIVIEGNILNVDDPAQHALFQQALERHLSFKPTR